MILSYGLGVVLTPSFLQNSHGTLIILAMELGKRFIRNPELPIRWFHQGILPVEVAQVFGNTAPAGKTHCLAGRTHCSPCIIHKLNVFHIHQKVWEIIFFSSVLLFLLLAISHPLSRDRYISICRWILTSWGAVCHYHCLKSPIWSHLAKITQCF